MAPRYQLFARLRDEEYAALKADITKRGVLIPVELDQDGEILDGHHRAEIAGKLGVIVVLYGRTHNKLWKNTY